MNGLDKSKKIIKRKPLTEKQAVQIMTKRRACIEKFRKTFKKAPIKAPRKKKEKKEAEESLLPEEGEEKVEGEPEENTKPKKTRTKKAPIQAPRKKKENNEAEESLLPEEGEEKVEVEVEPEENPKPKRTSAKLQPDIDKDNLIKIIQKRTKKDKIKLSNLLDQLMNR